MPDRNLSGDFPVAEFETRLKNAHAAMHAEGIDALFFNSEAEIRYFTGFRTLFWQSPTRPWFLVIPRDQKPIAIIPEIGRALMRDTWIDDIRSWSSPHAFDDGISLLTSALKPYQTIGMLMGRESALRMPLRDFIILKDKLSGAEFIDASPTVQRLRMVKSSEEIELIDEICAIASTSFENAANLFHVGMPLDDAFRAFRMDLLARGADDVPYLVGGAGQNGYSDVISPPSATPLREGDILMLDTGATLRGYYCDFDRNYAFGQASDDAKRAYRNLIKATQAALKIARPGSRCKDLHAAMQKVINQEANDVGRFGHGLGMQLTEAPSLIQFDETLLEENMVITLEPSLSLGDNKIMIHEENILIQDGPPRHLSRLAPEELPILST
ncbi:M24 family metallopeptidase [Sneathiella litorea]|uniref:M24 family metallopeptidase n=1 Tax=Sneathiella litorea TaxID=2606216 RepID=A0A6L8W6H5_9PROT|nr:Xaa-Pro peptidase family protein [Sneathiella litorea]MZR30668.1 M24 family metallopeptidase [Sneathiella litorea]